MWFNLRPPISLPCTTSPVNKLSLKTANEAIALQCRWALTSMSKAAQSSSCQVWNSRECFWLAPSPSNSCHPLTFHQPPFTLIVLTDLHPTRWLTGWMSSLHYNNEMGDYEVTNHVRATCSPRGGCIGVREMLQLEYDASFYFAWWMGKGLYGKVSYYHCAHLVGD